VILSSSDTRIVVLTIEKNDAVAVEHGRAGWTEFTVFFRKDSEPWEQKRLRLTVEELAQACTAMRESSHAP
jgi:hypothetical protein